MTGKFPVANDQAGAVFAEQGHADFEHGAAVGGVGVAAAVVEQVPLKRHMDLARADGDEQDVYLALAEIPFRAVDAQPQPGVARQHPHPH